MLHLKTKSRWLLILPTLLLLLSLAIAVPAANPVAFAAPTVTGSNVTFTLKAPAASTVAVTGEFLPSGAQPIAMTKDANGVWSAMVEGLSPNSYAYNFILNGVKISDPANRAIWSSDTSQLSYVLVPGPEADFLDAKPVPHGIVSTVRYESSVLPGTQRQMQVYTPPGYGKDNRVYPVLYLQHGGGGNDTDWIIQGRANFILDNMIAQGRMVPMIVVMPDGNLGQFLVSPPDDLYPRELMAAVVPTVEANFRVAPGRNNRAFAGLSLGGLQALSVLLNLPGDFAYVGAFSTGWFPQTIADLEQNHSDMLSNPLINKWTKLLWITVGDSTDIAYTNNYATLAVLDKYHINYTFVQGTGGHVWNTWRHNLWDFAPQLFRSNG